MKFALEFVINARQNRYYGYSGVAINDGTTFYYKSWLKLIETNFDKCFFVPTNEASDINYEIFTDFAKVRGIYKDTYANENPEEEYYITSNAIIASNFQI